MAERAPPTLQAEPGGVIFGKSITPHAKWVVCGKMLTDRRLQMNLAVSVWRDIRPMCCPDVLLRILHVARLAAMTPKARANLYYYAGIPLMLLCIPCRLPDPDSFPLATYSNGVYTSDHGHSGPTRGSDRAVPVASIFHRM